MPGHAVHAAIADTASRQKLSVAVMCFDKFEYLRRPERGVGILLEIADLVFQHVLDAALVPEILEQWVAIDDVLCRAIIAVGSLPDRKSTRLNCSHVKSSYAV